jgi:hypothetical protein
VGRYTDPLAETLHGQHRLRPWMSPAPPGAVQALAETRAGAEDLDLQPLRDAAMVRHARQRRDAARTSGLPEPGRGTPSRADTPATHERARQVKIAWPIRW